ncbi:uncharacterized protein V6R79_003143 [Siganus canaliculatus]
MFLLKHIVHQLNPTKMYKQVQTHFILHEKLHRTGTRAETIKPTVSPASSGTRAGSADGPDSWSRFTVRFDGPRRVLAPTRQNLPVFAENINVKEDDLILLRFSLFMQDHRLSTHDRQ